jgi:hypothetical protein
MTRIGLNTKEQTFIEFCCIVYYTVYCVGFIVIHNASATVIKPRAGCNYSHIFMFKFYKRLPEKCWQFFCTSLALSIHFIPLLSIPLCLNISLYYKPSNTTHYKINRTTCFGQLKTIFRSARAIVGYMQRNIL